MFTMLTDERIMEENAFLVTNQTLEIKQFEIDFDKVQTVEDIKNILKGMRKGNYSELEIV